MIARRAGRGVRRPGKTNAEINAALAASVHRFHVDTSRGPDWSSSSDESALGE
ncbi:hypothetical protein ACFY2R_16525 [Micromonospora olivasterospora]|uniref:hypothetical protein n=1 Tax=Micromonospora olivasterospora TaxID=1880 RepID=UPI0014787BBC|nr:hypothetical protein [Micromonospora olivasterospora]